MKLPSSLYDCQEYVEEQLTDFYSPREARSISILILEEVTGKRHAQWSLKEIQSLSEDQESRVQSILRELQTGRPVQYILGKTEFFGLSLQVNESVLIPRPETEELVEWVLKVERETDVESPKIWEIGTGSGCIAIALKKHWPEAEILATDITEESLEVARQNAQQNEVEIQFYRHDILTDPSEMDQIFDLIVSNPPYVLPSEVNRLSERVKTHEPSEALFTTDSDPLQFYQAIANHRSCLHQGGALYLEVHEDYAQQVKELLQVEGFEAVTVREDLSGHPRMVRAVIPFE